MDTCQDLFVFCHLEYLLPPLALSSGSTAMTNAGILQRHSRKSLSRLHLTQMYPY